MFRAKSAGIMDAAASATDSAYERWECLTKKVSRDLANRGRAERPAMQTYFVARLPTPASLRQWLR